MPLVTTFVLRLLLIAAGLVFAVSAAAAGVLMLAIWGLRAGWARLTGRPVVPFIVRLDPRGGFEQMVRRARAASGSRTPRADAAPAGRREIGDVTDVEPRPPRR